MNCDLINSKNSTPIKLGTCTVHVLCQLWVKCCIIQEFIVELNLSIKLKDRSFPNYVYVRYLLCFVWKTHSWSLSKHFIYILYTVTIFRLFFERRKFVDVKLSLYLILGVFFQDAQIPGVRSLGRINILRRRQCLWVFSMDLPHVTLLVAGILR